MVSDLRYVLVAVVVVVGAIPPLAGEILLPPLVGEMTARTVGHAPMVTIIGVPKTEALGPSTLTLTETQVMAAAAAAAAPLSPEVLGMGNGVVESTSLVPKTHVWSVNSSETPMIPLK